jgi:mannose-6-phosphate isomerase-like protein (cupin superfamily)
MKFLVGLAVLLIVVALSFMAAAAAGLPTAVTYVPHDKVTATMAKGGAIIEDKGGLRVLAQRRGTGDVEVHMKTNHVFIIVEGEATFITGGTLVGAKNTAQDEVRAASVTGGQTHHLTKGDVITIPANTPHWFKEIPSGTIAYYAVNIQN